MSDQQAPVITQDINSQVVKDNDFIITRIKGFWYITYLKIISRITFADISMKIETTKNWLYFIKGKPTSISINYDAIVSYEVKKVFAIFDLIFAVLFLLIFLLYEADFWWLFLTALFLFTSFGKSVIINLNNGLKVVIPADGIGADKDIIKSITDTIKAKAPQAVVVDSKKVIIAN